LTGNVGKGMPFAGVQRHKLHLERAKFVTGSSRWVKGQAQGLQPGGFKLWVNWIRALYRPTLSARASMVDGRRSTTTCTVGSNVACHSSGWPAV
jgi:hypothetical protein